MNLIKTVQDKDYSGLKNYVSDRIASIISDHVITGKNTFIANARGLTLEEYEKSMEKDEKEDSEKEEKGEDKDKSKEEKKD